MTVEEKISLIKENKDAAVAAFNRYLDKIYNMTDTFFDKDNKLKEGLKRDEKLETYLLDLREKATGFEIVRQKILSDDFNLSLAEIARVGIVFYYSKLEMQKQIEQITKACEEIEDITEKLMSEIPKDLTLE
jgi:hypothetical protein